jgi:sulfide:quinone oxidoreductase
MTIKPLTPNLSVSPQILPHQLADVAKAGFRSVICNLPDGEVGPTQPRFEQIAAAAQAAGLEAAYLPIVPGQAGPADVAALRELLARMPTPILAFCRSGNRSASLFAMAR